MLTAGIKGREETIVSEANSAKTMGSGTLNVFATPAMTALMEETAWKSVAPYLEEGCGTVGTELRVKHLAATPVGLIVTARTELIAVEGRKLVFKVEVFDQTGKIGEGEHERFIVANEKFFAKAQAKKNQ